ncbi:hypothetical protein [Bradyrhizobium iriomotense]|uniref:hypothetical protein n=1 Tax=Bradyrhizobium iriomotense TaxID=441950 RepID=UPI001B8A56EE|nr:hypothetical protein [Bradyrhizobium iriomotense]MBR0783926.1 hypothetical protein [Bradyrhizobium iriomotense]
MSNRIPLGILALQFWHEAAAYLRAAEILIHDEAEPGVVPPAYFLMSHGLELLLKTYLLSRGDSYDDVGKLKHDIQAAYQRACGLGLMVTGDHVEALVEKLSEFHTAQVFRYPIVRRDDGRLVIRGHLVRPTEVFQIIESFAAKIQGPALFARIEAARDGEFRIETWHMGLPPVSDERGR